MNHIKLTSTNNLNKQEMFISCPVTFTISKIGGRWKPLILYNLRNGKRRYNELRKEIPGITEKMLIQHLKQLEQDKLVLRESLPVVPPHVEYRLTRAGKEMEPILNAMAKWGLKNNRKVKK